jgi:hypothetical protein
MYANQPEEMYANQSGVTKTRSGRISKVPTQLSLQQSTPFNEIVEEYTIENVIVITKVISLMNLGVIERRTTQSNQFIQTFN